MYILTTNIIMCEAALLMCLEHFPKIQEEGDDCTLSKLEPANPQDASGTIGNTNSTSHRTTAVWLPPTVTMVRAGEKIGQAGIPGLPILLIIF